MYCVSHNFIIYVYAVSWLNDSLHQRFSGLLRPCPLCSAARSNQGAWDLVTSPARPVDQTTNSAVRILAIEVFCYLERLLTEQHAVREGCVRTVGRSEWIPYCIIPQLETLQWSQLCNGRSSNILVWW